MLTRRSFGAAALAPLAGCQSPAAASAAVWRAGPPMPYATQEIYPALHAGEIWVADGFAPQVGGVTPRVLVLDLTQEQWRDGPPLPQPAHHVHLVSCAGALYAIGGFLPRPEAIWACTPRVLRLDGEAWIEAPALPRPIGEAVPHEHNGRIHLIGGRSPAGDANADWNDQADVGDHFVLTPGATQWETAAALPTPRNSAAGVSDGARIHVISGRTVANGQTPQYDIYDSQSGAWREGAAFPEPRGGIAGAFWRGRVVAGGGEIFEPGSVGDTLYALESDTWTPINTMPTPRHGHGMISANNALYAIGGARQPGGNQTLASIDILD